MDLDVALQPLATCAYNSGMKTIECHASDVLVGDRITTSDGVLWTVSVARVIRRGKSKGLVLIMLSKVEGFGGRVLGEFGPTEKLTVERDA